MDLTPDEGCKGAIPVVLIGVEACGPEGNISPDSTDTEIGYFGCW